MLRKSRSERSDRQGDGAHRCARPRAHLHHAVGADPPFRGQLHPFRQRRQNALARLRFRRAVQRQLLHGLHVPDLGPVRARQPDPQGSGGLPARSGVAARHSLSGLDLRADADCILSDLPALPSARHHRFQLLSFLVAHADGWSLAVGPGMVLVGAAGARHHSRCATHSDAAPAEDGRLADLFAARPAVDGVCGVPRRLGRQSICRCG